MFRYFGFGSNMSMTSLLAKGVEPLASRRAVLYGWRLRFNVQHFFRHEGGVGNIEYTGVPEDRVLGVLHECLGQALPLLDVAEAFGHGYDRITVEVEVAVDEDDRNTVEKISALTYIGMAEFIDNACLPSRRYLNIVIDGARHAELDANYIQSLLSQSVHCCEDYPIFTPPTGDHPSFDAVSLAKQPLYTALYDAVFDMSKARPLHEYLKTFFGGQDMTLFHLRRLDSSTSKESIEDIRHGRLNKDQRQYLNAFLNEYAREYCYVGRYDYNKE